MLRFMTTITMTKPAQTRSTDKVVEALSTLGALLDRTINEVRSLDTEFQSRLQQAVHDTEASLQQQATEHLQLALEEAEQRVRAEVSEQMRDHYEREITSAVGNVRDPLEAERDKLSRDLDRAAEAAIKWEEERARLLVECDQAKHDAAEAKSAREKAEAQAAEMAAAPAISREVQEVEAEIARVQGLIKNISQLIEDPETDLATVIRRNVERAEFEAYLKGIRFVCYNGK
jgi:hypothetical protein